MHSMRQNRRALSEIVGTLFLVLIVVSAATVFAAFVAGYQSQVQAEEAASHLRSLESLKVLSVSPQLNTTTKDTWTNLTFVVASRDVNPTIIDSISVNRMPVMSYFANITNSTTGTYQTGLVSALGTITILPDEQFTITVDANPWPSLSSFYTPTVIPTTSYVQLDIFTAYSNDFSGVFVPPSAVAVVTYLTSNTGTGVVNIPILNGENSLQPANTTLESWMWNVTCVGTAVACNTLSGPDASWSVFGEEVSLQNLTATEAYTIVLTVTDSDGLMATTYPGITFTYE
jgi:flagellin-like protein